MRYDDTLETVLASDLSSDFGKQSAWRQLVDLIGRRRVMADSRAISVLRTIRNDVPLAVRAASARGLEYADPPPSLVRLLVHDDISVAAPVLRSARLTSGEWILLLPELKAGGRAILRHRRDLSPLVQRALESFGPSDMALMDGTIAEAEPAEPLGEQPAVAEPLSREIEPVTAEIEPITAEVEPIAAEIAPVEAEIEPAVAEAEQPEVGADHGSVDAVPAVALETAGAEALFDSQQESLGTEDVSKAAAIEAPVETVETGMAESVFETSPLPMSGPPAAIAGFLPIHWFGGVQPASMPDVAMPMSSPGTITEQDGSNFTAEETPEPAAELEAVMPPDPLIGSAPLVTLPVQPAETLPQIDVDPEAAGTVEAVPIEASEHATEEPDFSFVELALGGFAAATVALKGQASRATNGVDASDQSGTGATLAEPEPVAGEPGQAQESSMFEGVDVRDVLREPVADAPEPGPEVVQTETGQSGELGAGPFQIADVVARIDAFYRNREEGSGPDGLPVADLPRADLFRFETDSKGVIRWVDGVARAPVIGLSLDLQGMPGGSRVDGQATGAFRRRAGFTNARLEIEGESDAAGDWLISAVPVFDPGNGRFAGYRGTARRPRSDERAEPLAKPKSGLVADSLRQLVHELRTPTNAIAGFAEMIESEMLGPVTDSYRDRARSIRVQARDLLGAIDDLDLAARIESAALALSPDRVALRPLLAAITDDLTPLMALRGSWIALPVDDLAVNGDRRAVERLLSRLMATLVSASGEGERVGVRLAQDTDRMVTVTIDRPRALADYPGEAVLGIDDEGGDTTLLGTGFALRLARNLARELGGSMVIEPESLTLQLPAPDNQPVEHAHLN